MLRRSLAVISLLAILGLVPISALAAVSQPDCKPYDKSDDGFCFVWIYGEIKQSDVTSLDRVIKDNAAGNDRNSGGHYTLSTFYLNSSGGDVYAAMEIGRRLRQLHASVLVPKSGRCASACVLMLAGATLRTVLGPVVVHRPFSTAVGDKSFDELRAQRMRMKADITRYLEEMDVSQNLLEIMDGVPPDNGRQLSEEEMEMLRLSGFDPSREEEVDASWAARLGISRQELVRRKSMCAKLGAEVSEESDNRYTNCIEQSQ